MDRACERVRDVLGARGLVAPLDERMGHASGIAVGQVCLQGHQRAVLLTGGYHQRALVGLGVEDRSHPVAHSRGGVEVHERRPARGLGIAVGEPDDRGLLQPEHVAEVAGNSVSIGSSVEPGLPNTVVIECRRSSSNVASLTVVTCLSLGHGSGSRQDRWWVELGASSEVWGQYPGAHRSRWSSVQVVCRTLTGGSAARAQKTRWRSHLA